MSWENTHEIASPVLIYHVTSDRKVFPGNKKEGLDRKIMLANGSENISPTSKAINIQADASWKNERKPQKSHNTSKIQEDDGFPITHASHLSSQSPTQRLDNGRKRTMTPGSRDMEPSSVAIFAHQSHKINEMVQTTDMTNRVQIEIGCQTNEDLMCSICSKILVDKNADFKSPTGSSLTRVHPIPYESLLNEIIRMRLDRLHLEVIIIKWKMGGALPLRRRLTQRYAIFVRCT